MTVSSQPHRPGRCPRWAIPVLAAAALLLLVPDLLDAQEKRKPERTAASRSEAAKPSGFMKQYYDLVRQKRRGGPEGERAEEQLQDMDAAGNPEHPARDHRNDPGPGGVPSGYGGPAMIDAAANWPWGELYFENKYPSHLEIENECWAAERVGIFVRDLPYIKLPAEALVPPRSKLKLPFEIVTPDEPDPPIPPPTGFPPGFSFGHVDPPPIPSPQPHTVPPIEPWHQPNYIDVKGSVVLWHPWTPHPGCAPKREVYRVSGHIHFNPPDKDGDGGPEEIAKTSPCDVWWMTGERPAQLDLPEHEETDCTDRIRRLASDYLDRVAGPQVAADAAAWSWLSGVDVWSMSINELLELKRRIDVQLGIEEAA